LLNVFEVERDGVVHHLLGLIDPVLAGARGIDIRSILGEFTPGADGGFDPRSFQVNPEFIAAFQRFMNDVSAQAPELVEQARNHPGGWLDVIDSRFPNDPHLDPPPSEVVGHFTVDETGRIIPNSFQYNPQHLWFNPDTGRSQILDNRQFYDWLHRG
jgi:hypothetical protein